MRGVILMFTTITCFLYSQALECGFKKSDIENALSACVKNNETLQNILEMTSSSSTVTSSPNHQSDSGEEGTTSSSHTVERDNKKSRRTRRASKNNSTASKDSTSGNTNDNNSEEEKTEETTHSAENFSDKCVVQCMLKELDLMDDKGKPDQRKIIDGIMKNTSGRELQNFIQKTVDDCFELLEKENEMDSCEYSSDFVSCLAEEGRSNCADWPAGSLPV